MKQRWVSALRSGEYEQGRGTFRQDNKYCCLGVLAEIDGQLEENGSLKDHPYSDSYFPDFLSEYYGLNGMYIDGRIIQNVLVQMNDVFLNSFNEIADWIEKNL